MLFGLQLSINITLFGGCYEENLQYVGKSAHQEVLLIGLGYDVSSTRRGPGRNMKRLEKVLGESAWNKHGRCTLYEAYIDVYGMYMVGLRVEPV